MDVDKELRERLKRKPGSNRLHHREGQELEFKEQFNLGGLADYFRDFAAFSNNRGGFLVFGIKDSPREIMGLSEKSKEQFEKVDPEKITGYLLECFSSKIDWHQTSVEIDGMFCGAFYVQPSENKPVIAKKDEGRDQVLKNGDIYYRYGGRTQKIQSAELESIINGRVEKNNQGWLDLMAKIGRIGTENAAVLDTEKGILEKPDSQILVLDEGLASKIKFVKEGRFSEKEGAPTLKLVGDVVPVDKVEVTQRIRENIIKSYPYSAMEVFSEVQRLEPKIKQNDVWRCIADNKMKENSDYSVYNFRNKRQEEIYHDSGYLPSVTPSIYNQNAIDFIVKVLRFEKEE